MTQSAVLERILQDYRAVASQLPDSVVPRVAREHAAQELTRMGWPSARDEQWRYANLRAFDRVSHFRPTPSAAAADAQTLPPPLPGFERLVFVDGRRVDALSTHIAWPGPAWAAEQRLGLLCDMFASDTAALQVKGSAAIELLFVTSQAASGAAYPRVQVQLEPGSELKLVERHLGATSGPTLVGANVVARIARGAQLTHYRLQQCGPNTVFSDTLAAEVAEEGSYRVRHIALGAASARTSAQVRLEGRAASVDWQAIAVGRGEQVHDLTLRVEHLAPATRTAEVFRGVADERSRIAFSGHIQIESAAPGADARQSLRGLIEGLGAEIDLRPRLEINTDDVRAQHGATTGQLDQNLLFYLLARGIDPATARALLKWAFLSDVLRTIELPALRRVAEHGAAGQLPDVMAVGALS
jgi:Fe-S cluster assembly protein SufD